MKPKNPRYVTTKRANAHNPVEWVLGHYDQLDRMLLVEAVRVTGLNVASALQWNKLWKKRGFSDELEARRHAALKGMPSIVRLEPDHVTEALRLLEAGEV